MREVRQIFGYSIGLAIVIGALKFSLDAIALEVAGYVPAPNTALSASLRQPELAASVEIRDANAQPVWIAPTPKYQYDPKLMEVKPRHQMQAEAKLRRQRELARYDAQQREATRQKPIAEIARKAMASADQPSPPAFLMFSPN